MTMRSEQIEQIAEAARRKFRCRIRVQVSAGWGCTVLEIFEIGGDPIPLKRVLL